LIDLLDSDGDLTATECARRTGESVASCAFHLHSLAKYGYIEMAPRRGREKPWRSVRHRDARYDPDQAGSVRAVTEVARLSLDREADRLHRWLDDAPHEAEEWLLSTAFLRSSFWATSEELRTVAAELEHMADRFAGRADDPAARPVGARRARLFAALTPEHEG
jgi:hypothetical protein